MDAEPQIKGRNVILNLKKIKNSSSNSQVMGTPYSLESTLRDESNEYQEYGV